MDAGGKWRELALIARILMPKLMDCELVLPVRRMSRVATQESSESDMIRQLSCCELICYD